jgi:eukaryotic-like serine/threonine-protein kinase
MQQIAWIKQLLSYMAWKQRNTKMRDEVELKRSQQDFERACVLFDELIELPEHECLARLSQSGESPAIIELARAMWRCDARAAVVAQAAQNACQAVLESLAPTDDEASALLTSAGFGPWQFERELGRGGMGVVYKVQREIAGITQFAALKRIKSGMHSEAISARFLLESNLLSQLGHPNIARFLDAGTQADGTPWLVMEYVDGVPLLEHIRTVNASLKQRLALFIAVCAAVSSAHRMLIVHRDLKPSNVLVDRNGQVKLLDFGIAKLLRAQDDAASQTQTQQHPLTPLYAAPEQLAGQPISTATDVYGLGLLLFEILCLRPAHAYAQSHDLNGWRARLQDNPPPQPSACVARESIPQAMTAKMLRGDLDQITRKALAFDPERRYASVSALQEDIERFLQQVPIRARPDSWRYRVSRFVTRHRAACLLATIFLAALISVSSVALVQASRASREAARAIAVKNFVSSLFEIADPDATPGGYKLTARNVVDAGAQRLQVELVSQPELAAELSVILARIYSQLGDDEKALTLIDQPAAPSLARSGAALPAATEDVRFARLQQKVISHINLGNANAAQEAATTMMNAASVIGPARVKEFTQSILWQSEIARLRSDFDGAVRLGDQAISLARRQPADQVLAEALVAKAGGLWQLQKPALALPLLQEAQQIYRTLGASHSLGAIKVENNLCVLQVDLHQFAAAQPQCEHAVSIAQAMLPRLHTDVLMALGSRSQLYRAKGDFPAAIMYTREALALTVEAKGEQHPLVEFTSYTLASDYLKAGQFELALKQFDYTLKLNLVRETTVTRQRVRIQAGLAATLFALHRLDDAKRMSDLVLLQAQGLSNVTEKNLAEYHATHEKIILALKEKMKSPN